MTSRIRHITIDCVDAYALSGFWAEVTGWQRHPEDHPGDPECLLVAPAGQGAGLLFIQVPEGKVTKNRIHFDLEPATGRDEEAARLIALGAKLIDDQTRPDNRGWLVLVDPEGNEFCVERSRAEVPVATPDDPTG
jgi:predicted enzyme related to lactoylglutathione lyase